MMLTVIIDTATSLIEFCYVYILWVTGELFPVVTESIANILSHVCNTAMLVARETFEFMTELTSTVLHTAVPVIEDTVTRAIPLTVECVTGAVLGVWLLISNTCSLFFNFFLSLFNFVYASVTFIVPNIFAGISALVQLVMTLVALCISGTLTVVCAIWNLAVFLTSSALSITTSIAGIALRSLSVFFSGEIKHGLESFGSEPTRVTREVSVWLANMALEVLLIVLTLAILVGLASLLCCYFFRDCWRLLQHQFLARGLRTLRAVRNTARAGNAQQRVRAENQPVRNDSRTNPPSHVPRHRLTPGRARSQPSSRSASGAQRPGGSDGEQNRLCVVCLDNQKQVLLRPCMHYCVCGVCSRRLGGECPICRKHFTDTEVIHIYYD